MTSTQAKTKRKVSKNVPKFTGELIVLSITLSGVLYKGSHRYQLKDNCYKELMKNCKQALK